MLFNHWDLIFVHLIKFLIGVFVLIGIVLGVLLVGGSLMYNAEMTPGSMMAFLVATQTIQK